MIEFAYELSYVPEILVNLCFTLLEWRANILADLTIQPDSMTHY